MIETIMFVVVILATIATMISILATDFKITRKIRNVDEEAKATREFVTGQSEHIDRMIELYNHLNDTQQEYDKGVLDQLELMDLTFQSMNDTYRKIGDAIMSITQQNFLLKNELEETNKRLEAVESRYSDIYEQYKKLEQMISEKGEINA